jgi:hypothetical protein
VKRWAACLALSLVALGCFGRGDRRVADPAYGVEVLTSGAIADFHARAESFYRRLALRRINTFATYKDLNLRGFFQTEQAFSDYYADLAQVLSEAHFEKNRPLTVSVQEFQFDGPGRARVRVRLTGDDAQPLRYFQTQIVERYDRWERTDGEWWLVPGKL